MLRLPNPPRCGDLFPPPADVDKAVSVHFPTRDSDISGEVLRACSSDDGDVHFRNGQRELERLFNSIVRKFVVQKLQSFPVSMVVLVFRSLPELPKNIRERAFGDNSHTLLFRRRKNLSQGVLVSNIHGYLQNIQLTAPDGVKRRFTISAVSNGASFSSRFRALKNLYALRNLIYGATVKLNEINVLGLQIPKTLFNAPLHQSRIPVGKNCRVADNRFADSDQSALTSVRLARS